MVIDRIIKGNEQWDEKHKFYLRIDKCFDSSPFFQFILSLIMFKIVLVLLLPIIAHLG